jgi:hypothetical protein
MRESIQHDARRDQEGTFMTIVRLTYYSRNLLDRLGEPIRERINDVLIESVANNRRDDVTGVLIYDHKWFAQALEGPESAVSATFERILRDPRHGEVKLIRMQPVQARRFGAWWMTCIASGDDNMDLFRQHCEGEPFEPPLMRADRLGDLIEAVAARTASHQGKAAWTPGSVINAA